MSHKDYTLERNGNIVTITQPGLTFSINKRSIEQAIQNIEESKDTFATPEAYEKFLNMYKDAYALFDEE